MFRLGIRSFLISCEIENIISVGIETTVKPIGFKKNLSQSVFGIIYPDCPNQCQSYTLMELRDIPWAQVRIISDKRETTVLHCRLRGTCGAASEQRPWSWPGGWVAIWIRFIALFNSHVFSGTSTVPEAFNGWWKEILNTISSRYKDQYSMDLRYEGSKDHITTFTGCF